MAVVKPDLAFEDMAPALVFDEYERLHAWVKAQSDCAGASCDNSNGVKERFQTILYPLFLYSFLSSVQYIRNSIRKCATQEEMADRRISENKASTIAFYNRHRDEFSLMYGDELKEIESATANVMNAQNPKDENPADAGTISCYILTKFVAVTDIATFQKVRRYISESRSDRMELIFCTYILPYTKPLPNVAIPQETQAAEPLIKIDPELLQSTSPAAPSQSQPQVSLLSSTLSASTLSLSPSTISVTSLSPSLPQPSLTSSARFVEEYAAPPHPSITDDGTGVQRSAATFAKFPARGSATVMIATFYGSESSQLSTSAFSPNGNSLVAGFSNGTISLWDSGGSIVSGGLTQHTLHGHAGPVYGASFERTGGNWLASCGCDGTARLWDIRERMECVSCFKGHAIGEPLWDIAWSPAGQYFATAGHDKTALMWSPAQRKPVRVFVGHQADVSCLCFHPNGSYLVTASEDCHARIWDVVTGRCVRMIPLSASATRVEVSPNGKYFVAGFYDGTVRAFDIKSGRLIGNRQRQGPSYPQACAAPVYAFAFSRDGTSLAVGSEDSSVRIWDTNDESLLALGSNYDFVQTYYTRNTPIYALSYVSPNVLVGAGPYNKVVN